MATQQRKPATTAVNTAPQVKNLALNVIFEDKNQPRKQFDAVSLQELTATVKLRGVKSPISVRPNPAKPGTYIINHGARRYRACRNAGLKTIPAFIDSDYSAADQVIENLHRDSLTAREIADFIGREIAAGKKKIDISKLIGKSNAFVSMHLALLDLPEPIAQLFSSGKCTDVTAIYALLRLYKNHPQPVSDWITYNTENEISRVDIQQLKKFLQQKDQETALLNDEALDTVPPPVEATKENHSTPVNNRQDNTDTMVNTLLSALYIRVKKEGKKIKALIKSLTRQEKHLILQQLQSYFEQGRSCTNIVHFMMQALQDGRFATRKAGAFNLTAFLHGVDHSKVFNFDQIMTEATG